MSVTQDKKIRRVKRIRGKLKSIAFGIPRLLINKSNRHIFTQIINDKNGQVLAAYHSQSIKKDLSLAKKAQAVGEKIAQIATKKDIKTVKFDRSGYQYHGCVKIFADSARQAGLNF